MSISSRLAFSIFFITGVFVVYYASREIVTQLGPRRWQTTTAKVTRTAVAQTQEGFGEGAYYDMLDGKIRREGDRLHHAREQDFYEVHVSYQFEMNGQEYRNRIAVESFSDVSTADKVRQQKYPVGGIVDVLYNPLDPSEHSFGESLTKKVIGLFVFLLMGFAFALVLPAGEYLAHRNGISDA